MPESLIVFDDEWVAGRLAVALGRPQEVHRFPRGGPKDGRPTDEGER